MTDPTITDTAIEAFRDGWISETDLDEHVTATAIRAGLAAAYPHLAAQALREAAVDLTKALHDRAAVIYAVRRLNALAYAAFTPTPAPSPERPPSEPTGRRPCTAWPPCNGRDAYVRSLQTEPGS